MKKFVLGIVNDGDAISGLAMVTLFNNVNCLRKEMAQDSISMDLILRVVSSNPQSYFCRFAKQLFQDVEILQPGDWSLLNFPHQKSGSFATYWKFELFNSMREDEFLLYIDADAIILNRLNLGVLIKRMTKLLHSNASLCRTGVFMMTPSHRPNLERIGYTGSSNPYCYYNAGVIFALNPPQITMEDLASIYDEFYCGDPERLFWHDQDLINSVYSNIIYPLPLRYNVSTGMLRRQFYGITQLNYLAEREIAHPVVAHASGGILSTSAYFPWRDNFLRVAENILSSFPLEPNLRNEIEIFIESTHVSPFRKLCYKVMIAVRKVYVIVRNRC